MSPSTLISDPRPELWRALPPAHFDTRIPAWLKIACMAALTAAAFFIDQPVAAWVLAHKAHIYDATQVGWKKGDIARELMLLEQFGQWICTMLALAAVAFLDRAGRRKALAIGLACLATVLVTYLIKDLTGRNRPYVDLAGELRTDLPPGSWIFAGPHLGFTGGARWGSFPSAHTTAAFALAAALSWFYPRARGLFMTLALITATQRVLHAAHYVSDVLAGLAIGVGVARSTLLLNLAGKPIAKMPPAARTWWLRESQ